MESIIKRPLPDVVHHQHRCHSLLRHYEDDYRIKNQIPLLQRFYDNIYYSNGSLIWEEFHDEARDISTHRGMLYCLNLIIISSFRRSSQQHQHDIAYCKLIKLLHDSSGSYLTKILADPWL